MQRARRWARIARQSLKGAVVAACERAPARRVITWRGRGTHGTVALTFDDGPHPEFTYPVLETLARHDVKATFFVVGSYARKHPTVMRAIVEGGHEIGNHTFNHSIDNLPEEIRLTDEVFEEHGVRARIYRPPYNRLPLRHLAWLAPRGFSTIIWSHDTRDSLRADGLAHDCPDPNEIRAGDIIIMHDDNQVCVDELDDLIRRTHDRGLRFVTTSELV